MQRHKLVVYLFAAVYSISIASVSANILSNPGFETNLDNWYVFDGREGSEVTRATDITEGGSAGSLKIDTLASDARVAYDVVNDPLIEVTPGVQYDLEANYYVGADLLDQEAIGIGLFWYKLDTDTGDWLAASTPGDWTVVYGPDEAAGYPTGEETVGAWTIMNDSQVAPTDAEYMQVAMQVQGRGSAVYFDSLDVVPEPLSVGMLVLSSIAIFVARRFRRHIG